MKCPKCKREIEDHSKYCEYCGHKIKNVKLPWVAAFVALCVGVAIGIVANINQNDSEKDVSICDSDVLMEPKSVESLFDEVSCRALSEYDLQGLSKDELRILRNEIYARHGLIFHSEDLTEYFNQFSWYHPYTSDAEKVHKSMTDVEKENINFIKKKE